MEEEIRRFPGGGVATIILTTERIICSNSLRGDEWCYLNEISGIEVQVTGAILKEYNINVSRKFTSTAFWVPIAGKDTLEAFLSALQRQMEVLGYRFPPVMRKRSLGWL